jgi:ubiquinone/menaquinone biosynthesis C-methylase UbiE
MSMDSLKEMYQRRFGEDVAFRKKMWEVLCAKFFQRYIPAHAVVLDVAAGYCEFINNIKASRKIALDLNPDVKHLAGPDVEVVLARSTNMRKIKSASVDVAFTSNFFEHITREDIAKTIEEVRRVLKPGGAFLVLQPNIRFTHQDYWMFFDHITAIDDRALCEVLELHGFAIKECRPKFLPYTTKGRLPKSIAMLKLYLHLKPAQSILGKQAFVHAIKKN